MSSLRTTSSTSAATRPEADRGVREPFAALPHSIAGRADVSPTEKAVLLALLFWARAKAVCWPSDRSIGDRIGRSPGTVQRALRRLEAFGLVERRKVTTNTTGRELVLRWRLTPDAPVTDPRRAPARDEYEKGEKSKTPRIGREATATESEGEAADDPAELARLAECADMPEPIRRMAAAALARLGKLAPDVAATGLDRVHPERARKGHEKGTQTGLAGQRGNSGATAGQQPPARPADALPRPSTTEATLIPPRTAYGPRRRPAWLEGMVRQLGGG